MSERHHARFLQRVVNHPLKTLNEPLGSDVAGKYTPKPKLSWQNTGRVIHYTGRSET
jgi:hypothetical protein